MPLTGTDRRQLQFTGLVVTVAVLVASGLYLVLQPPGRMITAYFPDAAAVFEDNSVRVLGVSVGTITQVVPEGTRVRVEMRIDDPDVQLPAEVNAAVVSPSVVTGRYVQLTPPYTGGPELTDGAVIPLERTAVPPGIDDLTRTATELSRALGPDGLNSNGVLSDVLDVGAANLDGNGAAVNTTIHNLGELSGTLADSRDELFGTVTELQKFVSTLAANDAEVREFSTRLEDVSGFLAGEREDLGAAVSELSIALGDVAGFVRDNRAALQSSVGRLTDVTEVLVEQRESLAEVLDVAPAALGNLANVYNGSAGTLDTRADINELTLPPVVLICEVVGRTTPPDLPESLDRVCTDLEPVLSGAVPLPSPAEVITALQAGSPPPVPGLALPIEPPVGPGLSDLPLPLPLGGDR
jgi:phospholipid/cholesterol/gamma-HCH transport system substrate-binding protein